MPGFEQAGLKLFALSYDEPDALRAFAEEHGITFELISDPNSEVIKHFGILNTLIPEDDHPWHGIPFPGAYVFQQDGLVRFKFFEGHLGIRAGGELLLSVMADEASDNATQSSIEAAKYIKNQPVVLWQNYLVDGFDLTVKTSAAPLAPGSSREMYARLVLPPGRDISLMTMSSNLAPIDEPWWSSSKHQDQVVVWLLASVYHSGDQTLKKLNGQRVVPFEGTIKWKMADTDEVVEEYFELELPAGSINAPHHEDVKPGQMDASFHMDKLRTRRGLPAQGMSSTG